MPDESDETSWRILMEYRIELAEAAIEKLNKGQGRMQALLAGVLIAVTTGTIVAAIQLLILRGR
jgi:hypothetical protein